MRQNTALRKLLAGDLPLERVGPQLRQSARRALRSGDIDRLLKTASTVARELLRQGELIPIEVKDHSVEANDQLCLLKGTSRVLDLSGLNLGLSRFPSSVPQPTLPEASPPVDYEKPRGTASQNMRSLTDVLGAMEDAQDLEIGDPESGDKAVMLGGIVRLLRKFTPQVEIHVMLKEFDVWSEDQNGVFQISAEERHQGWLELRNTGQSVWIPETGELPQRLQAQQQVDESVRVAVAVPLWEPLTPGQDEAVEAGLLFLVADGSQWTRDMMLRLAERLARFVTRRWQHQHDVNQRIHTDSLTGVFNRAYFDTQFTLEIERARRTEVPLTLVIADIDHFKRVNDDLGHLLGDQALRMVARRLQEELRRIDHICRIGGEEFALILPGTGQEAGQEVMGRLLDAIFSEVAQHNEESIDLKVTFSYGAVTFPAAGIDPFELYRKADAMLYLSKDLGRNQCHFWNSQGEPISIKPTP